MQLLTDPPCCGDSDLCAGDLDLLLTGDLDLDLILLIGDLDLDLILLIGDLDLDLILLIGDLDLDLDLILLIGDLDLDLILLIGDLDLDLDLTLLIGDLDRDLILLTGDLDSDRELYTGDGPKLYTGDIGPSLITGVKAEGDTGDQLLLIGDLDLLLPIICMYKHTCIS